MKKTYLIEHLTDCKLALCNNKTIISKKNDSKIFVQIPDYIELLSSKDSITFTTHLQFKNEFINFVNIFDHFLKSKEKSFFTRRLKITGLGYKMIQEQDSLTLSLGYSKVIKVKIPTHISNILIKKNLVVLNSTDKIKLGDFVSQLCILKKRDVYKGKGLLPEYKILKLKPIKKK